MESVNITQKARLGFRSESPSLTNSPITTLHSDILREIFLINANIFTEEKCLKNTCRSSQVCHAWRSLILDSPTIWGRLIELSALERCTKQWREEVLKRSGDSLLWVYGRTLGCLTRPRQGTDIAEFFYHILDAHWERIEHLDITVGERHITPDPPIDGELWRPLLKPAPYLRSISVFPLHLRREYLFTRSNFSTPATPLFSNRASVLRKFFVKGLTFNLASPWLSYLRDLSLSLSFSVSEILNALRSMPLLMNLTISEPRQGSSVSTSLPSVILASLTTLQLKYIPLPNATELLTHIYPSDGCNLYVDSKFGSNANEELQALSRPLSGWFQNHLRNNHVTELYLSLNSTSLRVRDNTSHTDIHKSEFRMAVTTFPTQRQALPLVSFDFPSLFTDCNFSTITQLSMIIPHLPPTTFAALCSLFTSVTDLSADENTLATILQADIPTQNEYAKAAEPTPLFPLLHTLRMCAFGDHHPESDSYFVVDTDHASVNVQLLLQFFRTRSAFGAPIQTLDIGIISDRKNLDITFLEEITGLVVVQFIGEEKCFSYTCGSGKPESLLFRATSVDF
ncbi:hypothetical protein GALMADRAFT_259864 [Galerina marginata CBS 339.88]|uniref:F-box domain-containing protein n=1 Tax=Galerina marginata (strain CBS 339.88) TaxID=685588 RepID=A0A067S5C8_GALM3|nr:hypothetical protein GALMADRAFT_259864 [Galerina marginata CBS 339.88]